MNPNALTRRDFLKTASIASAAVAFGCMHNPHREGPVIYPKLKPHKIQAPEYGCLFGIFKDYAHLRPNFTRNKDLGPVMDYYQNKIAKIPALVVIQEGFAMATNITGTFPKEEAEQIALKGAKPQIYAATSFKNLDDIASGMYDRGIHTFADGARKFGEQHGGFFLTTMWEMNISSQYSPWKWAANPDGFQKVWRRLHKIFGENGANDYATWMVEYHVDFPLRGYFPGEDVVDWIGLSAYNRKVHEEFYRYRSLETLTRSACDYFGDKHPNIPVVVAEGGSTVGSDQPRWIANAFKYLKSAQQIKAFVYWDSANMSLKDDHRLQDDSLTALKANLNDSYFITAKSS